MVVATEEKACSIITHMESQIITSGLFQEVLNIPYDRETHVGEQGSFCSL